MSVKSVNLRGYKTLAARAHRTRRESTAQALIEAMRAVGMSEEEIKAELHKIQAMRQEQAQPKTGAEIGW